MAPGLQRLKYVVKHPYTQFAMGLTLLISGGAEIFNDFYDTEHSFQWGAKHGVAIFGLVQILGNLPGVIDGLDRAFNAVDERSKHPGEVPNLHEHT